MYNIREELKEMNRDIDTYNKMSVAEYRGYKGVGQWYNDDEDLSDLDKDVPFGFHALPEWTPSNRR